MKYYLCVSSLKVHVCVYMGFCTSTPHAFKATLGRPCCLGPACSLAKCAYACLVMHCGPCMLLHIQLSGLHGNNIVAAHVQCDSGHEVSPPHSGSGHAIAQGPRVRVSVPLQDSSTYAYALTSLVLQRHGTGTTNSMNHCLSHCVIAARMRAH